MEINVLQPLTAELSSVRTKKGGPHDVFLADVFLVVFIKVFIKVENIRSKFSCAVAHPQRRDAY
jgi:hypothetical protein